MSHHPSLQVRSRCLLVALAAVLLLALALPVAGQGRSYIPDLDIVLVIDESGSLWEMNDPPDVATGRPGWRIVMAHMFADLLGVDQSGARHRLGIVTFGLDAKVAMPLTEVQSQSARDGLKQSLIAAHTNMGWTDIPKALSLALEQFEKGPRSGANVRRAIVFLSDGKCQRHEEMTEAETGACNQEAREVIAAAQAAQAAQCPIYTIAFTSDAFKADSGNTIYKNLWQEIASNTQGLYFEPENPDRELLDAYIKIIRHLFGLPGKDVAAPVEAPTEVIYQARGNLLQVIFTIIKYNKDITATLVRPDGTIVQVGDPGVEFSSSPQTDSYSIMRPQAGRWIVRLNGSGKVTFVDIPIPITARVEPLAPGSTHPLGKPMDIAARVVDAEMQPLRLDEFSLQVTLPDGAVVSAPLTAGDEAYTARLDDTTARGSYRLSYSGQQQGSPVEYEQTVDVIPAPWVKLLEPQPGQSYPFDQAPIKAQLMLASKASPADARDRLECVAQLEPPGGQPLTAPLQVGRGGVLTGTLKAGSPGTYPLRIELTLTRPSGERFQDATETTVTLVRGGPPPAAPATEPPPKPSPTPARSKGSAGGTIAGVLGALLALAAAGGAGWWWYNQPALAGSLQAGADWFPLAGRRPVTIGSGPRCQIPVTGEDVRPRHAALRATGSRQSPQVEIRALDPAAPLRVNGVETTYQILQDGDTIEIGDQSFTCSGLPGGVEPMSGPSFDFGRSGDGGPGFDEFSSH